MRAEPFLRTPLNPRPLAPMLHDWQPGLYLWLAGLLLLIVVVVYVVPWWQARKAPPPPPDEHAEDTAAEHR